LKFEEDIRAVTNKNEDAKEEKKQNPDDSQNNNQANKSVGGLKGLLSGSSSKNDTKVKLCFY